jgi:hypothetical protein
LTSGNRLGRKKKRTRWCNTKNQDEREVMENLDELAFLAETAGLLNKKIFQKLQWGLL